MVGRVKGILLSSGAALASIAAAPGAEREQMLAAFDAVLGGMAYAGVGLCLFAIVWAGFVLMAEGAEGQGRGIARSAVLMAVVGLVVVCWPRASPDSSSAASWASHSGIKNKPRTRRNEK